MTMKVLCVLLLCLVGYSAAKTLMLAGGYISNGNSEIWNKLVSLSGGRGQAKIGILTTAADSPVTRGRQSVALIESYGAKTYWIPIHEDNANAANDKEVVQEIKSCTGFYFAGGKQQKYVQYLLGKNREPTLAFQAIMNMYNNGTVVMGTSAGAMVMPKTVTVVDGNSYSALQNGALKVGEDSKDANNLVYDSLGGLGFFDRHVVDSHFHERGRHGRLIRLLSDTKNQELGTPYGIGIDEETAIIITGVNTTSEEAEVIGNAGVVYIDVTKALVDGTGQSFRILNVYSHYLTAGDKLNLQTQKLTLSGQKQDIRGNERNSYAQTSADIFAECQTGQTSEFRKVAESLFDSRYDAVTYGSTFEDIPSYYVIMTEDSTSRGYFEQDGDNIKFAYYNMKLEIRPTPSYDEDDFELY